MELQETEKRPIISKSEILEYKLDKLIKIQDLNTIQNSLLAIFFGLLIFALTIFFYYKQQNLLIWLISIIVLLYDVLMLVWILLSIFSQREQDKLHHLETVLFYLIITGSVSLITFFFLLISFFIQLPVSNLTAIILLLSMVLLIIFLSNVPTNYLRKRFNMLYRPKIKREYHGNLGKFLKIFNKNRRIIFHSVTIGLLVSILSGLLRAETLSNSPSQYGFPFTWMELKNETLFFAGYSLLIDWAAYIFIFFIILYFYNRIYSHFRKKKERGNSIKEWGDEDSYVRA